eukprot:816946-Prymnesium_polylepis.1
MVGGESAEHTVHDSKGTTWRVPGCVHAYRMSVQSANAASRIRTSLPTHDIAGIALRAICICS